MKNHWARGLENAIHNNVILIFYCVLKLELYKNETQFYITTGGYRYINLIKNKNRFGGWLLKAGKNPLTREGSV